MIPDPFPGNSNILKISLEQFLGLKFSKNHLFQDCLVNFLIFMEEDASNGIMPLGTDAQTNTVQAQGQTKDRG